MANNAGINHAVSWPNGDFTRVPYSIYTDREVYDLEQERIFRGPTWSYLGLSVEIPKRGDFITSSIGDTSVVVNRNGQGEIRGFLNRCTHRGATLCRQMNGNVHRHVCVYHQWCFDLDGNLIGVPYQQGIEVPGKGKFGGMPEDFQKSDHSLRKVRVETYQGLIFGTFSDEAPSLKDYLEPSITQYLDRFFERPVKIIGRTRQQVPANWKLYLENTRDPYHAMLLHPFMATFGAFLPVKGGGVVLTSGGQHSCLWYEPASPEDSAPVETYKGAENTQYRNWLATGVARKAPYQLNNPASLVAGRSEFEDGINVMIMEIFPSMVVQQISNTLAIRKVVPQAPDKFEIIWNYLGYQDDDPEMEAFRLKQANMIGPAGFISMEDGEAARLIQSMIDNYKEGYSVVEMGGRGEIATTLGSDTEVAIRGMYKEYCKLMGYEVA